METIVGRLELIERLKLVISFMKALNIKRSIHEIIINVTPDSLVLDMPSSCESVHASVSVRTTDTWSLKINVDNLLRVALALPGEFLYLQFESAPVLTIKSDKCIFKLACSDVGDAHEEIPEDQYLLMEFKASDLHDHLKKVSHSMCLNDWRHSIASVKLDSEGDNTVMISTDGHRLTVVRIPIPFHASTICIPTRIIKAMMPAVKARSNEEWSLYANHKTMSFRSHRYEIYSKLNDKLAFPDYQSILPSKEETKTKIDLDIKETRVALKRCMAIQTSKIPLVVFRPINGCVELDAKYLNNSYNQLLEKSETDMSVVLGMNAEYLMDILKLQLWTNRLVMHINHALAPIHIEAGNDTIILMPMHI